MNIKQLRQSVKIKWLSYYEENRSWLVKMRVWATYDGLRRPSSGFILATLSVLEPQFNQLISFILNLNNNPDEIVTALGLNFNPDEELCLIDSEVPKYTTQLESGLLAENYTESQAVPLVAVTPQLSPGETLESQTLTSELPRLHEPVSASRENTERIPREKFVSSVAVASQVASRPATKKVNSRKPRPGLLLEDKPVRSPLAITIDVLNKAKTLPSRKLKDSRFHYVPIKFGTLLLQRNCLTGILFLRECLKPPVPNNCNHGKMPPQPKDVSCKVNLSPHNQACSLASWVDEFCQGSGYDPRAAISMRI